MPCKTISANVSQRRHKPPLCEYILGKICFLFLVEKLSCHSRKFISVYSFQNNVLWLKI